MKWNGFWDIVVFLVFGLKKISNGTKIIVIEQIFISPRIITKIFVVNIW